MNCFDLKSHSMVSPKVGLCQIWSETFQNCGFYHVNSHVYRSIILISEQNYLIYYAVSITITTIKITTGIEHRTSNNKNIYLTKTSIYVFWYEFERMVFLVIWGVLKMNS